jgi:hypothetical protein
MRNLLHAPDRDRLVAHLRGTMLRDIAVGERRLVALAEAEGAGFCAAADNALAAELLAQPEIRDADPAFADGILGFVMAMADAPLRCRRAASGGLEVPRDDPRDFEILTPFHRFTGNLSAGILRQQPRGTAGGEAGPVVLHTGNLVEFRIGRHRSGVDVEDTIGQTALRRVPGGVVLMHESRITGTAGLFRSRQVEAGTLRYEYEIRAASPLLRLTVTFTAAPGQRLRRLRLTTAVDQLGAEGTGLAEGLVSTGRAEATAWRDIGTPAQAGLSVWADEKDAKPVPHLALGRPGWPAQGPVLHIRPAEPDRVMSVKAVAARPGALHWLILRHGPADLSGGLSFVIREDRLLAGGGTPRVSAAVMEAAARAGDAVSGLDLEPMPPIGAALNAVATQLVLAAHGAYRAPLPAARVAALEAWYERELAALLAGPAMAADLGFAALATEARLRAGGRRQEFDLLMQRILAAQAADGRFQEADDAPATLAGHAVLLLALARATTSLDAARLAGPIGRALAAVQPGTVVLEDGVRTTPLEGLALAGAGPMPLRDHALATGLMTRALGAVLLAAEMRPDSIPAEALAHARVLHRQAVALLRPLVRPAGATLEVAPSPLGGPANAAGQAAVVLALMAPDAAILRLAPVAA